MERQTMATSKSTNELAQAISSKKVKKQPKSEIVKAFMLREVWNGRPIHWLAIVLSYTAIAYASYELAKYFIGIPEFNGICAFVITLVVGSRTFKK